MSKLAWLVVLAIGCSAPLSSGDDDTATPIDAGPVPVPDAAADASTEPPEPFDWRAQVIYLAMVDRFANGDPSNDDIGNPDCFEVGGDRSYHGGDIAGLRARMPYLRELGATAIWTTPLYAQDSRGCGYHGYWAEYDPADPMAIERRLGTAVEVRAYVDDLHAANMVAIFDLVVNHTGRGSALPADKPEWFHDADDCERGPEEHNCTLAGLPDFAQENPEVAEYLSTTSQMWVETYGIDGVRMDTAKHVPLLYFENSWFPAVRRSRADLFVLGEVFDGTGAFVFEPYMDAGFSSVTHFPMRYTLRDVFGQGQSLNGLADRVRESIDSLGLERALWMTLFLANHDVPRWPEEMPDGTSAERRLQAYRLALATMFTVPGIPQLYQGDELGLRGYWPDNRRLMPAWSWSADDRAGDHPEALPDAGGTFEFTRDLIAIRRNNPALYKGYYSELWRQNAGPRLFAFFRGTGDSRIVVVIHDGNEASGEISMRLGDNPGIEAADAAALVDGAVFEELLGAGAPDTVALSGGGRFVVDMPPRSIGIYRLRD